MFLIKYMSPVVTLVFGAAVQLEKAVDSQLKNLDYAVRTRHTGEEIAQREIDRTR